LQRCPTYTAGVYEELRRDPGRILLLGHERGVPIDPAVAKIYHHRREHDPSDLAGARALAERCERVAIGLFFHDPTAPCYEEFTTRGMEMTADEKLGALDRELDCFAI
jgi:2-oxoglutarate ferredoxin oxidoreductase subunit beta